MKMKNSRERRCSAFDPISEISSNGSLPIHVHCIKACRMCIFFRWLRAMKYLYSLRKFCHAPLKCMHTALETQSMNLCQKMDSNGLVSLRLLCKCDAAASLNGHTSPMARRLQSLNSVCAPMWRRKNEQRGMRRKIEDHTKNLVASYVCAVGTKIE